MVPQFAIRCMVDGISLWKDWWYASLLFPVCGILEDSCRWLVDWVFTLKEKMNIDISFIKLLKHCVLSFDSLRWTALFRATFTANDIVQGWTTYGPWAACGPRQFLRGSPGPQKRNWYGFLLCILSNSLELWVRPMTKKKIFFGPCW